MHTLISHLEDLADDDIALRPHLEVKTCDRFRWEISSDFITPSDDDFQPKPVTGFYLKVWSLCDVVVSKIS